MPLKDIYSGELIVYNEAQKTKICLEVITGKLTTHQASKIYHINAYTIKWWIQKFRKLNQPANLAVMNEQLTTSAQSSNQDSTALQKTNEELQEALRFAELKIAALETLIDTAEAELSIEIRKKSVTKQ